MTLASSLPPAPFAARLLGACVLAATLLAAPPAGARTQFTGDPGTDLTRQNDGSGPSTGSGSARSANDTGGGFDGQDAGSGDNGSGASDDGSTHLRSPSTRRDAAGDQPEPRSAGQRAPYVPGEFERYVQRRAMAEQDRSNANATVRRFGANLMTDPAVGTIAQDPLPAVPGDYIIRPGDEILLTIWGTVDGDLRLRVDRSGRISVPRIGAVDVAGLRNDALPGVLRARIGQTYRNFQVTATLGQVRAIRVFVSGYAVQPGSITLNGMASVLHAIMRAGGPSAAGSFRDIHLRRQGREVATFDLYDLLLKGNRDADQLVQPDDVIFIGPVGKQVALLGSVNQEAIYELKPGEKLEDVLRMAGGFTAVADRRRVTIERLADRASGRVNELALPDHLGDALDAGDLVRAYSVVTTALPLDRQNKRVHVEGEVARPGDYLLPPGSHIADALRAAGGLTPAAYPFGTEFSRESVRLVQQANYDRALRDLETDITKNQASQRATSQEEVSAQAASAAANARLLDRLRQVQPTGRIVLQIKPDATGLPDLALEDGDRLSIPPRSSSVGVFGSVFTTGSFLYAPAHTTQDYIALAGGPTRGADRGSEFMIRANGSVISARQGNSFWHSGNDFSEAQVQPGDTIFVPEEINKSTFVQDAKDWTQILYQFGLGLAGIKSLGL